MNSQVIQQILDEHAKNPNTAKVYNGVYNAMSRFEIKEGCCFEDDPLRMLFGFVENQKYISAVILNTHLLCIKYYLRKLGCASAIEEVTSRDIDFSKAMLQTLVPSLEDMYQRARLVYLPENGDAIFPLCSFAWMGLTSPQAIKISEDAIDLQTGVIRSERALLFESMPQIMIDTLRQYKQVQQSNKGNGQIKIPDRNGSFIYKNSFAGSSSAGKNVADGTATYFFAKVREAYYKLYRTEIYTTYKDVTTSAKYYKARLAELRGTDWNKSENDKKLQAVFGTNRIEPAYLRHNYNMYKKAFGLK